MADFTKEQLNDVVTRVLRDVNRETQVQEGRAFGVADLRSHLADLGKAGTAAWTISYSTASANVLERLGAAAWTISYSTSSAVVEAANAERAKR